MCFFAKPFCACAELGGFSQGAEGEEPWVHHLVQLHCTNCSWLKAGLRGHGGRCLAFAWILLLLGTKFARAFQQQQQSRLQPSQYYELVQTPTGWFKVCKSCRTEKQGGSFPFQDSGQILSIAALNDQQQQGKTPSSIINAQKGT